MIDGSKILFSKVFFRFNQSGSFFSTHKPENLINVIQFQLNLQRNKMSSNNINNTSTQTLQPSIDHTPYSNNTTYITDSVKQQYQNAQVKFQEPQVQEKWCQVKNVVFERSKEFGFLTLDYAVKTFEISKTAITDLYAVYKQ